NVVGLTQAAAQTAIVAATLTVGTVTLQASTTVAAGLVISQTPAANSQVPPGSAVALVVSSGPAPVAVPNVVGLTQAAAQTAIVAATLTVGTVTPQASTTVAEGLVISQTPLPGASVLPGSAVALVVSTGSLANMESGFSNASGTFIDLAYTVPDLPGQNLVLVVYGGAEDNTTNLALPASATFAGRTLTLAGRIRTPGNGTNSGAGIFWMSVQANEKGTIRLTFTGSSNERAIGAVTLVGAALGGPTVVETSTGNASLTDLITTTTPNTMVISVAAHSRTGVLTATGTGHVRDVSLGLASSRVAGGHAVVVTPATVTLGYSGSISRIAMVLAAFPVGVP
ncbi:MAG: PASTA domain-containing protein, partial [Vicinamibacterales bacterium]